MGRVPDFDKFDGNYFGLLGHMAETLDPQARLLLETTYEAIVDAGLYMHTGLTNLTITDRLFTRQALTRNHFEAPEPASTSVSRTTP